MRRGSRGPAAGWGTVSRARWRPPTPGRAPRRPPGPGGAAGLGHILSSWMIMPLILLFLLRDTGDINRGLLGAVPNRLFEPALAVLADVDETLGGYVRGIFLECCTVG